MYERVEKPKEDKGSEFANSVTQNKGGVSHGFGFVDDRLNKTNMLLNQRPNNGVRQYRAINLDLNSTISGLEAGRNRMVISCPTIKMGLPIQRCDSNDVRRVAESSNQGVVQLVQYDREKQYQHYSAGFNAGYEEGRWRGIEDGIAELNANKVLSKSQNPVVRQSAFQGPPGVVGFERITSNVHPLVCSDDGHQTGDGLGYDEGFEYTVSNYGYRRQYGPIPQESRQLALADNNGTCVYCNLRPSTDVDHVIPLRAHWQERGSTMNIADRTAEANDILNLVGSCAHCNRGKGAKIIYQHWTPPGWHGGQWWEHGPARATAENGGRYWQ